MNIVYIYTKFLKKLQKKSMSFYKGHFWALWALNLGTLGAPKAKFSDKVPKVPKVPKKIPL